MATANYRLPGAQRLRASRLTDISAHSVLAGFAPLLLLYALYTVVRWTFVDRATTVGDHNALLVMRFE